MFTNKEFNYETVNSTIKTTVKKYGVNIESLNC